jgi:hypothetical protein
MNPKDAQGKEITWRNAAALEGYVKRLNYVAERVAEKNRQLRKWHDVIRDKVCSFHRDSSAVFFFCLTQRDLVWHDVMRDKVRSVNRDSFAIFCVAFLFDPEGSCVARCNA